MKRRRGGRRVGGGGKERRVEGESGGGGVEEGGEEAAEVEDMGAHITIILSTLRLYLYVTVMRKGIIPRKTYFRATEHLSAQVNLGPN